MSRFNLTFYDAQHFAHDPTGLYIKLAAEDCGGYGDWCCVCEGAKGMGEGGTYFDKVDCGCGGEDGDGEKDGGDENVRDRHKNTHPYTEADKQGFRDNCNMWRSVIEEIANEGDGDGCDWNEVINAIGCNEADEETSSEQPSLEQPSSKTYPQSSPEIDIMGSSGVQPTVFETKGYQRSGLPVVLTAFGTAMVLATLVAFKGRSEGRGRYGGKEDFKIDGGFRREPDESTGLLGLTQL